MLDALIVLIHSIGWLLGIRIVLPRVRRAPLGRIFLPALLYKVAMGWLLGIIFLYYYQHGDTLSYFEDARQLAQWAYQQPLMYGKVLIGELSPPAPLMYQHRPRALLFTKIASLVTIFTYGNYWITSAYFSLLSFVASWKLASYLSRLFPRHRYAAAVAFLWYPSVVFWGSGLLKESVAVASIAVVVYTVLWFQNNKAQQKTDIFLLVTFLIAGGVLWKIKYYYAGLLFPVLLAVIVAHRLIQYREKLAGLVFLVTWLVLVGVVSQLHPVLALDQLAEVLLQNHDTIIGMSAHDHVIRFQNLNEHLSSFLRNLPLAIVSGLFRPWVGDSTTALSGAAVLENTALLVAAIGAVVNQRGNKSNVTDRLWIVATLTYTVTLGGLLAFASPNFGSLVRYKVAFLPFFVFLCLAGNDRWLHRIKRRLLDRVSKGKGGR